MTTGRDRMETVSTKSAGAQRNNVQQSHREREREKNTFNRQSKKEGEITANMSKHRQRRQQ